MIIKLYDIQDETIVRGSLEGSKFKRPEDTEVSFLSPIEYEIQAMKISDSIWLKGPVRAHLALTCARCLENFDFSIDSQLDIELRPKDTEPRGTEVELRNDELDIYYYEGDEIEIDSYIFEEIMLDIPIKALCSDACKGICPTCGKNLNAESCRCAKTGTTVLGEKLQSLLKKEEH
jgi:uncharacterized protein